MYIFTFLERELMSIICVKFIIVILSIYIIIM
jgi:hypothetical protein